MTVVPSLSCERIIKAFQRAGFLVVRQRGSHIRIQKRTKDKVYKLTVPAHRPVKRSTLSRLLKSADITPEEFSGFL